MAWIFPALTLHYHRYAEPRLVKPCGKEEQHPSRFHHTTKHHQPSVPPIPCGDQSTPNRVTSEIRDRCHRVHGADPHSDLGLIGNLRDQRRCQRDEGAGCEPKGRSEDDNAGVGGDGNPDGQDDNRCQPSHDNHAVVATRFVAYRTWDDPAKQTFL